MIFRLTKRLTKDKKVPSVAQFQIDNHSCCGFTLIPSVRLLFTIFCNQNATGSIY